MAKFAKNGEVSVALQDRSSQAYEVKGSSASQGSKDEAPPLFSGQGRRLADGKDNVLGSVDVSKADDFKVDPNQPTTALQFRFHDGKSMVESSV